MFIITDNVLRERVFKKTSGKCFYCGKTLSLIDSKRRDYMTCDHLIPRSKGGNGYFHNLVPACKRCNMLKMDSSSLERFRFEISMEHFQKRYDVRFTQKQVEYLNHYLKVRIPVKKFIFYFEGNKYLREVAKPLIQMEEKDNAQSK